MPNTKLIKKHGNYFEIKTRSSGVGKEDGVKRMKGKKKLYFFKPEKCASVTSKLHYEYTKLYPQREN
jgi:hypothetical protein